MKLINKNIKALTVLLVLPIGIYAQNPTDACGVGVATLTSNASCINTAYTLAGTYANAGQLTATGCTAGNDRDDGWYQFVATGTSTTVQITGDEARTIAAFTGSCGTGQLACNQAAAGTTASITFATTCGTTYYLQVHRRSGNNTATMTGNICISASGTCPASPNMGNGGWSDCGPGNHYDSGGSGGAYSNNELITETYCSDVAGDCIQFNFTAFSTESCCDDLTIYDGPTTGSPLIGTYAGTTLNGQTITSTSGCLTFVFDSDGSITSSGWTANYTCVPCPVPTCSDGIQNQGETGIDCGGPCPPCPPVVQPTACANATYTLTTLSTYKFYDDGGAGGDNCADQAGGGNYCNCNCFTTTTICAAPGEFIVADFNEFAMWNTTSGWDWMRIYDNNAASGTVLYDNSATGPDNPFGDCGQGATVMNFCSTGQCLTFEFWATSVVNRAGWDCDVSSVAIACTLPVEFLSFTGENDGNENVLTWVTASEINNDYFIVEASSNNMESFIPIGTVDGAGNSSTEITYSYRDNNVTSDITYYRLKQVDLDGASDITSVIAVRSEKKTLNFYPNPASTGLTLDVANLSEGYYKVVYTDILGSSAEELLKIEPGKSAYPLSSFNDLSTGIYFIKIQDDAGNTIGIEKVIKE